MISFIIIGRNEGKKLKTCIGSVYHAIHFNNIRNYEILYVDSKSVDNSLEVVSAFEEVKIFSIQGYCNAAIARNIGAGESKGSTLYFIDADMEISADFLKEVLNEAGALRFDAVSGIIVDVVDDKPGNRRFTWAGHSFLNYKKPLDGGIFLIKRQVWDAVDGMRTKYDTGEDGDLGLRLAAKGFQFVRLNQTITLHYTVPYLDKSRMWKFTLSKPYFCSRSVLYRDHLWNKHMYRRLWEMEKTLLLLIFCLLFIFSLPIMGAILIPFYLLGVYMRSKKQKRHVSLLEFYIYFLISDLMGLFYLLTFFPKNKAPQYQQQRF